MAIKKQETNESQDGLSLFSKTEKDELRFLNSATFNSLQSSPSTDATIIIDDEEVTLEPMKKKPRSGSRFVDVDPFDELSNVVKGLPKAKKEDDVASRADSCYSSSDLEKKNDDEKSLSLNNVLKGLPEAKDDGDVASRADSCYYSTDLNEKKNDDEKSQSLSNVLKGLPDAKKDADVASRADSCYSSTDLNEKKNDDEKSLSTVTTSEYDEKRTKNKNDDAENVVESTPSNKGYGHVSLEDLGVSVEDLKKIPWEAFDPTWELRSDPCRSTSATVNGCRYGKMRQKVVEKASVPSFLLCPSGA